MEHEPITAGEWTRWLNADNQWKGQVLEHLVAHGERLATLEAQESRAAQAASTTKKWAVVGGVTAAVINGILVALGVRAG